MATVAQMVGVRGVDGGHHGIRDVRGQHTEAASGSELGIYHPD